MLRHLFLPFFSLLLLLSTSASGQSFLTPTPHQPMSFREMQRQFHQFKKSHDLSKENYWKNFKRYEADMQLKTNGHGEPDGFGVYLEEAIRAAEQTQARSTAQSIWYPIGPNGIPQNLTGYMENGIGRVNCVGFHPSNPLIFYVGVAQGGVWKTTNGGTTYVPITDQLPITRVSDICVDPVNPNTLYISLCDFEYIDKGLYLDGRKRHTHYGLGVYKSTDAGLSWSPTGLSFALNNGDITLIRKILVNPSNNSELLACGVSGLYRSVNGGNTWTKKMDSLFWDMEQDPVNPSIIYAATGWVKNANTGHAGIYKSSDFGNTWVQLNSGIPAQGSVQRVKLAIAPSNHNLIYAITTDLSDGLDGIYVSNNAGLNWTYKYPGLNILENGQGNSSGGQGPYDLAAIVDLQDPAKLFVGGINVWGSNDTASTFDPATHWTLQFGSSTIHGDIHYMARQPVSQAIFVCSDGGIYKTNQIQPATFGSQWPTNWTNLSDGMQCTSFYRIASSKNTKGRIVAGAQDNATFYYNGTQWNTIFGGDGMDCYLDPINHQDILGSSQFGNLFLSQNDGFSGSFVGSNPNFENSEWTTPIVADYNHPGVLYVGNENVVKSTDGGQNWMPLTAMPSSGPGGQNTEISALAVASSNSLVIYAARRVRYEFGLMGRVFKSVNGGTSFANITSNLPDTLYYTSLDVNPQDANDVCITMAGFAGGCKIFRTTNGGVSWSNLTFNLPNVPANCVKFVPGGSQILVASDIGIYLLNGNVWTSIGVGLPNVILTDIEFNPALNKIYVSSFGRGIWESSLSSITAVSERARLQGPEFMLFPSVGNGTFTLDLQNELSGVTCEIYDVKGQKIFARNLEEKRQELKLNAPPGCYFVKLEWNQVVRVQKLIIE